MSAKTPRAKIFEDRDGRKVDIFERSAASAGYPNADRHDLQASYVICFEERSGSTMLCSLLEQTNVLGKPDEFFNPRGVMQMYLKRSQARDMGEYYAYLHNETATGNGVFGFKTTFADLRPLLDGEALAHLLVRPRFVLLSRDDIVRQAVSSALARKREVWHAYVGRDLPKMDDEVAVDIPLVSSIIERILDQRRSWESFFSTRRIEPLRITYEELIAQPREVVRRVAQLVGITLRDEQVPATSRTLRLSNATNEAWVGAVRAALGM